MKLSLAIAMKNTGYIGFMYMLFGSMSIITSMSYDEQVGWNRYVVSMPLKKVNLYQRLPSYYSFLLPYGL